LAENATGNMIKTDTDKIVVIDSLDDFIVVEEKEILLIFPKSKEQDIKQLRERVRQKFGDQHI
jgi:mannose-1-phosphate guanylyltransferase